MDDTHLASLCVFEDVVHGEAAGRDSTEKIRTKALERELKHNGDTRDPPSATALYHALPLPATPKASSPVAVLRSTLSCSLASNAVALASCSLQAHVHPSVTVMLCFNILATMATRLTLCTIARMHREEGGEEKWRGEEKEGGWQIFASDSGKP